MTQSAAQTPAVVITGASTGIGAACATHLAGNGWRVFAGVRKTADADTLAGRSPNIVPIIFDVTDRRQIAAAVETVRNATAGNGLCGLVNNAGVGLAGPLECMPLEEIERMFSVNVFGVIAATQAFLPLIRSAQGRIVLIGSNSGFWCEPFLAAYGGAKHAIEAIGDSLRVELAPWKINIAIVEPGMIRTPIWEKSKTTAENILAQLSPENATLYTEPLNALRAATEKGMRLAIPPQRVAKAVAHALEAKRPRTRYRVGPDSQLQGILRHLLPDRLRDKINKLVMGL